MLVVTNWSNGLYQTCLDGEYHKGNGIYLLLTSFIYDKFCFVNFYKIFNFYNIVRNGKRKWKKIISK
jgi:hypothetical protein